MRSDVPETMRAVVCHGPENYALETLPVPEPRPGQMLVKVEAVGICASDLKCYHGAPKFWGDENRPAWAETEVVPGHEFVGIVVKADESARGCWKVEVGDRVVAEQIVPCGKCRYCLMGGYWMCLPHIMFGFKRATPGAMAEYMIFPEEARVHKIRRDIPPQHAAYAEPLSCAMHAIDRASIKFDDVVVVAGAGPIGLGMVAGAREKGPRLLISLDAVDEKLALAKKCGADITLNITKEDPVKKIQELTDGYGADVYIEGTGHPSAVSQGLNLLRKLGTYVEYSVFGSNTSVDWSIISDDKELNVLGAHLGPHCWPAAIKLIESGKLPMDDICSHQFDLADFQAGLDLVGDSSGKSVKVSLIPSR